jgi:hypothetical protein
MIACEEIKGCFRGDWRDPLSSELDVEQAKRVAARLSDSIGVYVDYIQLVKMARAQEADKEEA